MATTFLESVFMEVLRNQCDFNKFESDVMKVPRSERTSHFHRFLRSKGLLPWIPHTSTKSTSTALKFKKLGNVAFFHGEDIKALQWYTRSVAFALPGSSELAIAYANRSAAHFRLDRFEACLVDINRALNENYPDASKRKLHDRKKKCMGKLDEYNAVKLVALRFMEMSISDEDLNLVMNQEKKNCEFDVEATDLNYDEKFPLPTAILRNKVVPNVSEKLRIDVYPGRGRRIVATEDIEPGEVLGIETPYVSALSQKYTYSHCSNCYVRCESLIPCFKCALVMYCSKRCRQNAFDKYHRIECKLLAITPYFEIEENGWLAFRLVMIATKQGEDLKMLMDHSIFKYPDEKTYDRAGEPPYYSQDYLNIHNLKDDYEKKSLDDLLLSHAIAAVFIHLLRGTEFFDESEKTSQFWRLELTPEESYAGHLLSKYFLMSGVNAHGIVEVIETNGSVNLEWLFDSSSVGSAIYQFHSLFNHSCDGNVVVNSHKDTMVSRSIRKIKAGQQLFINFGPPYEFRNRKERRRYLREDYSFICHCPACEFNWPLFKDTPSYTTQVKPNVLKKLNQYTAKFHKYMQRECQESSKFLNFLCEYSSLLQGSVRRPCKEYLQCRRQIELVFAMKGNYYDIMRDCVLIFL